MRSEEMEIGGVQADIVIPDRPNGKWIWTTESDRICGVVEQTIAEKGYTLVRTRSDGAEDRNGTVQRMADFHSALTRKVAFLSPGAILFGSRSAWLFAQRYPHRVAKLCLAAPNREEPLCEGASKQTPVPVLRIDAATDDSAVRRFLEQNDTMPPLPPEHLEKRKKKHTFVLRLDAYGSYLQREMSVEDYFAFTSQFPDEADKVILDMMYAGDWYAAGYKSSFLPSRRTAFLDRFAAAGIEALGEWTKRIQERGKSCWLSYRISEVFIDEKTHPVRAFEEHPDWFIPAFGYQMQNLSVPEIREQKLKVIAEVMRRFPLDGLDIDFERHTPILPPGKQWEMREHVTDFMRMVRRELLQISKEQNRTVMLSARIPDCLKGCREDGLDVEEWIKEDLVDCLTLGSRSFDVKLEEFRAIAPSLELYGCYDPHHTVDGYTFPELPVLRGVWYSFLQRGADAVEYFNWTGEGKKELVDHYLDLYPADRALNGFVDYSHDDFTGINDREFLANQDKTYVIDRKGGYPWGVGYANLNADRPLPVRIEREGEVFLYVAEEITQEKHVVLHLLFEELSALPQIFVNGRPVMCTAKAHRDRQVTAEAEAPVSGYNVSRRLCQGIDLSKPCTMLTADGKGLPWKMGYNAIRIEAQTAVRLEKVELEVRSNRAP